MYGTGAMLDNSERGCGFLKERGFYATGGTPKAGGRLRAWTWLFSSAFAAPLIVGEPGLQLPHNYLLSAPPRGVITADLRWSLHSGFTKTVEEWGTKPLPAGLPGVSRLNGMQGPCLVDHVGNEYSPLQFATEAGMRGPNRRIPNDVAEVLANYMPVPVLFTHSGCMVAKSFETWQRHIDQFEPVLLDKPDWRGMFQDPQAYVPSHWVDGFGFRTKDNPLREHPQIAMHTMVEYWRQQSPAQFDRWPEILPAGMTDVTFAEMAFGASWFTQIIYVCAASEGENAQDRMDLVSKNITPVYAGEQWEMPQYEAGDDEPDFGSFFNPEDTAWLNGL